MRLARVIVVSGILASLGSAACSASNAGDQADAGQTASKTCDLGIVKQLPSGTCAASDGPCTAGTNEICPDGTQGVSIDYRCDCVARQWSCNETDRTLAICLPADAAVEGG